jgi:hypothetical protein
MSMVLKREAEIFPWQGSQLRSIFVTPVPAATLDVLRTSTQPLAMSCLIRFMQSQQQQDYLTITVVTLHQSCQRGRLWSPKEVEEIAYITQTHFPALKTGQTKVHEPLAFPLDDTSVVKSSQCAHSTIFAL